jgi:Effector-associated domain 1
MKPPDAEAAGVRSCFLSYSPLDARVVARLEEGLAAISRAPRFEWRHRDRSPAGAIDEVPAAIVVLGGDFTASPSLRREADRIGARAREGRLRAVLVRARPAALDGLDTGGLPVLPEDGVLGAAQPDDAYARIADRIHTILSAPLEPPGLLEASSYPWSDTRGKQLHELLMSAYTSDEAIRLLASMAAVELHRYPRGQPPQYAWSKLLNLAAKQRRLRALVERVLADKGVSAYHDAIRRLLSL